MKTPKEIRTARYKRIYARNRPAPKAPHYSAELRITPRSRAMIVLRGVPEFLQQFVRMQYGEKGKWGHGKYHHGTKKGPGRRPLGWTGTMHPTGTKLVRRFIRDAKGEQVAYRTLYARLTGKQYGAV